MCVIEYEKVKSQIGMHLLNKSYVNKDKDGCFTVPVLDLDIYFFMNLGELIYIKESLLEKWKVTKEELFETAKQNMYNEPYMLISFPDVIEKWYPGYEPNKDMEQAVIVTNTTGNKGAIKICNVDVLEELKETFEKSFWLIPVNVDKWIAVPEGSDPVKEAKAFNERLFDTYQETVYVVDWLSLHIYHYDYNLDEFETDKDYLSRLK